MNIAMADAVISIWNAKNVYDTWRPITAIQQAGTDGNPDTTADPSWTPLLVTPVFQEYPSGHAGVSQAGAGVLAAVFGDNTTFTLTAFGLPSVQRSFTSFSDAVNQVSLARIWGGIHFRLRLRRGRPGGRADRRLRQRQHRRPRPRAEPISEATMRIRFTPRRLSRSRPTSRKRLHRHAKPRLSGALRVSPPIPRNGR